MVNISPTLADKIERRAARAFRYYDDGVKGRIHRITGVKKDSLSYRIPRSSRKTVTVVRDASGDIVIDPPTTGIIEIRTKADLAKLKNLTGKLHAGEVRGYVVEKKPLDIGPRMSKTRGVLPLDRCKDDFDLDKFAYEVRVPAGGLKKVSHDSIKAAGYEVERNLDAVQDLGFTTGLLDLTTNADVDALKDKLKRHLGRIRAYKYTDKNAQSPIQSADKITYEPGKEFKVDHVNVDDRQDCGAGINLASLDWIKKQIGPRSGSRAFAFECDPKDVAAIPRGYGKFRVRRCDCIEELDPKTFKPLDPDKKKPGLFDKLLGRGED